jgi:MFS family permease
MDWVCDDAWKGPFSQSMTYVGACVGAIVFGGMSDYYGRFPTFVLTNVILLVFGVANSFCTDFISFTLVRFAMGTTFYTFYMLIYVLSKFIKNYTSRNIIKMLFVT